MSQFLTVPGWVNYLLKTVLLSKVCKKKLVFLDELVVFTPSGLLTVVTFSDCKLLNMYEKFESSGFNLLIYMYIVHSGAEIARLIMNLLCDYCSVTL